MSHDKVRSPCLRAASDETNSSKFHFVALSAITQAEVCGPLFSKGFLFVEEVCCDFFFLTLFTQLNNIVACQFEGPYWCIEAL